MTGIAVALLLAGCAQQALPGGPTPSPTAPGATTTQLTRLSATSSTSLHLEFSGPVGASAADPSHYRLSSAAGVPLGVLAAYVAPDGRSVELATRPQTTQGYVLTLHGILNVDQKRVIGTQSFTGSALAAAVLSEVIPLSETELLLGFTDPLTGQFAKLSDRALQTSAYVLSPALDLSGVRMSQDAGRVIVTTSPLTAQSYTMTARTVLARMRADQEMALVDPQRNQVSFSAPGTTDSTRPVLKRIVPLNVNQVELHFSEPLSPQASDRSLYQIKDSAGNLLGVSDVQLSEFRTAVTLTTTAQVGGAAYTLTLPDIQDVAGHLLDPASILTFTGFTCVGVCEADHTPPRVSGAVSLGNSSVLVTFSEPVRGGMTSAENPQHYRIAGLASTTMQRQGATGVSSGTITPQVAALDITSAVLQPNGTSVLLTTRAQSDIRYELQVTGVSDLAGNQIAPPERGVDPGRAVFTGRATTGSGMDSDGDGLTDAEELRGWSVRLSRLDGSVRSYEVTSDPDVADTDGDGFTDRDEKTNLTDPRDEDTDDDQINDEREYNLWFSNPTAADTDGDSLGDGLEVNFFATSPLLADTDGDQISDDKEVTSSFRNARIADLPAPALRVSGVDLRLDTRFTATSSTGQRELDSKSASTSLEESQTDTEETSEEQTSEWFIKAGLEVGGFMNFGISEGVARGGFSVKATTEGGKSGRASTNFTRSSVKASQQAYASTLATEKAVERTETITRSVEGASMAVGVELRNTGNIAFTISNIEVTAFMMDPARLGARIPVATLKPESGVESISIGPFNPVRGPLRFKAVEVYPALIEQLMQDPRGLSFQITNYEIKDELGRSFAYTSQQINERTAEFVIDFGGALPAEKYNLATTSTFTPEGYAAGMTMKSLLEDVMKLRHYDASADAGLSEAELNQSYSTRDVGGVDVLWRVRGVSVGVAAQPGFPKDSQIWLFTKNNTYVASRPFNATVVQAGESIRLSFNRDADGDGMSKSEEDRFGSLDTAVDSDGDGLTDPDEAYGPLSGGRRTPRNLLMENGDLRVIHSNPNATDTDGDGLLDCQELQITSAGCPALTYSNLAGTPYTQQLDPSDVDTDGDGIQDGVELRGYMVKSVITGDPVKVYSDPFRVDTDKDGLPDAVERLIGTDPQVPDSKYVTDSDGDGLTDFQEEQGWLVTYETMSGPVTRAVSSDPDFADKDGDGLRDPREKELGTDPNVSDTDGDGLRDDRELTLATNPLKADTDADGRSDGAEVTTPWLVFNAQVFTSPLKADEDADGLNDSAEQQAGTHPQLADTDGDDTSDANELNINRRDNLTGDERLNPLVKDKRVRATYISIRVDGSCDGDDSPSEIRGRLGEKWNNGEDVEYYMLPDSGEYDKNTEVPFPRGLSRTHTLLMSSQWQLRGWYMYEYDSGDADDTVSTPSADITFDEITSLTVKKSMTAQCGGVNINFFYTLDWIKQ